MTFDEQVAALRGKVEPRNFRGGKSSATAEQWASHLDYQAECSRRWRRRHPDANRRCRARYYSRHSTQCKAEARAARDSNRLAVAKWRASHRDEVNAAERRRRRERPSYRLAKNLRLRLRGAVRSNARSGSAVRDLGCSIEELKVHIERQWTGCMSWENWGSGPGTWQIDHVYPLAQTDLTSRTQLLAVCNWRNLQPLWHGDNVRKGDTVTPEAQQLFDGLVSEFTEVRDEVA
jgi:hypothetical protein